MSGPGIETEPPASWPDEARDVYEGLQTYRIVGASACVTAIMRALQAVASQVATLDSGSDVTQQITEAGARFCALKPSTAAYVNAVQWLLAGLDPNVGAQESAILIAQRAERYAAYSQESLAAIVKTTCEILPARGHILINDYSSTVLAVTDEAGRRGRTLTVFVTAGQPVDQGPRVAQAVARAGHRVVYLPDAGIGRVMGEVDLVLSGVETLFRNGDLVNTVGTYPIALTAREAKVPVYGVTERVKIHPTADTTTVQELTARVLHPWPPASRSQASASRYQPDWDQALPAGTDVRREVLDLTPARLITGYVTEEGMLAPREVGEALERLYKKLATTLS